MSNTQLTAGMKHAGMTLHDRPNFLLAKNRLLYKNTVNGF